MGHNIKRIIKEEYVNYMLNERLDDIEKLHEAKWNFSEPAVRRAAALLAKAMTKVDGVKIKVHDFEWDEGRGAGFELSWDGDKGDGGSYGISDKGEVINHAYPGNPVYGHIKSSERDFEKGIRKYSKRRNESINEGKEYYVIQSLKTGKPKYVKDVGWKVRDNPMWVSDRNISKAYKYKTLKDARKYLESYPPQQTEFWHIYKMPSGNADLGPDLKESINEGKSFYQDVVDLNKSFRLLKIQSPDSYKEIDKKFKVRDIQKLLSNIKTFMDTVPAMREGKVNEAQLQDLPIRSLLGLGVKATVNMGEKKLYDLSEAFEGWLIDNDDNTYEGITAHLDMAIELIQEREPKEAKPHLKKFNKECAKALKEMRRFDEAKFNKKSVNEMQVINKKTGKDVTKHMLAYMEGKITKEEFEKLTGLSKEKIKVSESDAEYAKSLQTIARDKQLKMLSKKDKETLLKIADLMKRANEGTVDVSEEQMAVLKEKLVFYVDKKGKKRRFDTDASANKKYTKK